MSRRPNQVSLKDLFTTNPGELLSARYASDSALDSASQGNSQYPYSQAEIFDSQDGQQLPHSQNLSQSPTTRFFNRYMAKGSVIGRDSSQSQIGRSYSAPIAPKLPTQQQIQLLKARTQEQDERDLWNSLVSGIRECSAEVRVAVACLKESTQLGIGSTECQLTAFSEKIQSSLEKSQSVIVETLSNRDSALAKETELHQQLAIKNARIEELERQIQKMSQEKQDVTNISLKSTGEDLSRKITESLDSFFIRNQDALTHLEVVQEKHDQLAVDQMKQYLQQNFHDQKDYMKSFLEGFKTIAALQNETMQMQNGMLTAEILKSLHIVQENQLKGFEELLIHQIKELLEKKELNQKEFFEEQYQRLSAIQQEQRHEVLRCLQAEIQNLSSEQQKQFLCIIEDFMSQEKNRCFQLLKELQNVNNIKQRFGEESGDNMDPVSSKSLLSGRIDVIYKELAKHMNKNDIPKDPEQEEGLQILRIPRKVQPDMPSVPPTKRMACDSVAKNFPSTASLYEFHPDPAPTALSCKQSNQGKSFSSYGPAMEQTDLTSTSSSSYKGDKPGNAPKFVSPMPSGKSRRFTGHSYVCNDSKVNPSPVALVIPRVQAPKPLELDRNSAIIAVSVVQSTTRTQAISEGTANTFSNVKNGSYATPVIKLTALPTCTSIVKAKATTISQVQPSSMSRIAAFANATTPQARTSSLKTPITKELIGKYEIQESNVRAVGRKVTKKRQRKSSRTSQSRKRARKQPVVEVGLPDKRRTSDNRKLVSTSNGKTEKIASQKQNHKQSVIKSKVLSPMAEVFDFHSDTSAGSDDDSPENMRFCNRDAWLSTYSRGTSEGKRLTRSSFDFSKRHLAPKLPDFSETCTKARNRGLYSSCSKPSAVGKTGGECASLKEICNSTDLVNNNSLERNPISKQGYCSSSTSSSPCWSLGDILKLSEL